MSEITNEVVVKTERGDVVARIRLKNDVLHDHCEWYDSFGMLVAYGFFENGHPFTGTFLNWANFFGDLSKEEPYQAGLYCQDWVTIFEASFLSEPPKYEMVIEAYFKGQKIITAVNVKPS